MKRIGLMVVAGMLAAAPGGALAGTKVGEVDLSGNVALTTDYVWRGVSQTDENAAIQGGFDAAHDLGFYVGAWGSNVDFNDGDEANMELDLYGGYTKTFDNNVSVDLGLIRYIYPGADGVLDYDFTELYLGAGYTYGMVTGKAKYSYSPDFGGPLDESASYLEANVDLALPEGFTVSGHLGHSFGDYWDVAGAGVDADGYVDYGVSVAKELAGFTFTLAATGTDGDGEDLFGRLADDRIMAKISRKF